MAWDRYHLVKPLWFVPEGVVYEARDGDRAIHLAVPKTDKDSYDPWPEVRRRLAMAQMLSHSNVVSPQVVDLESEPPFVVVPIVDPPSLEEWSQGRLPLSLRDTARIGRELAETLAAAHRLGLAHGRLSPATIRITPVERPLLDFTGFLFPASDTVVDCRAPEASPEVATDPLGDLFSLGILLSWLLTGVTNREDLLRPMDDSSSTMPGEKLDANALGYYRTLHQIARELKLLEPTDRPSANDVAERLAMVSAGITPPVDLGATEAGIQPTIAPAPTRPGPPAQLGRFRILDKLGEGGMGTVYRAEDLIDGGIVAIKLLKPELAFHPRARKRFEKEARMLKAVSNPYVANLLDVSEQDGQHFIALEFVAGKSLKTLSDERGRLDEPLALSIIADVCRALVDAHAAGIVHRDLKPENVLLPEDAAGGIRVKLLDFGLAREIEQSASMDLTRDNLIGTPLYMAPEQSQNGPVDARTDIYSLGATLFHLLAGKPPFTGDTPLVVLMQHANEPVPRLTERNPTVSDGVVRLVERALAKRPEDRFRDAADLLAELERLIRGEPSAAELHPRRPAASPDQLREYVFKWDLEATPDQLWPHVSNTERLNRAIGLPSVQYENRFENGRLRRLARSKKIGIVAEWEEHPFEWVEGRRFGVLREMSKGPFEWIVSIVDLEPRGRGTTLTHTFRLVPRGLVGKLVAAVEVGIRTRKSLDRVYRRIDQVLTHGKGPLDDHFQDAPNLSGHRLRRLERGLQRLQERGIPTAIAERLGEYLLAAPDQAVARIRPLNVAGRLAIAPDGFTDACLLAAHEGILILMWDILCPVCRIPSQLHDSLKTIQEHGRCEACNLDFELDFANSVEMIFRVHPEVRASELGVYCIGGPAHSPHVAAQLRLAPGERLELPLNLPEGAYRLRGPQLPYALDFTVAPGVRSHRWDFALSRRPGSDLATTLSDAGQLFALTNDTAQDLMIRIERQAPRGDALTAARAAAMPLFRELFPGERLAPGLLVSVSHVTILVADLVGAGRLYRDQGDSRAFSAVHEMLLVAERLVKRDGGAVVKTLGAGLLAVFPDATSAVRAALDLPGALRETELTRDLPIRVAVHRGPALTATIDNRMDYFGTTINFGLLLPTVAGGSDVILSRAVATDAQVADLLEARHIRATVVELLLEESTERFAHRISMLPALDATTS